MRRTHLGGWHLQSGVSRHGRWGVLNAMVLGLLHKPVSSISSTTVTVFHVDLGVCPSWDAAVRRRLEEAAGCHPRGYVASYNPNL